MASAIGPGDWVRYMRTVDTCGPISTTPAMLDFGEVYEVDAIVAGEWFQDGYPGVELCGFTDRDEAGDRDCWDLRCFDPVDWPRLSIIEALKQPLPDLVDA